MIECLRCKTPLTEGLTPLTNEGMALTVREEGFFGKSVGRVYAAACPNCGHVELYLADTEKLKALTEKKEK